MGKYVSRLDKIQGNPFRVLEGVNVGGIVRDFTDLLTNKRKCWIKGDGLYKMTAVMPTAFDILPPLPGKKETLLN